MEEGEQNVGGIGMFFFFQAEDGIRDLVRSRGLGDVYKRQGCRRSSDFLWDVHQDCGAGPCRQNNGRDMRSGELLSLIHI